MTDKSKNVQEEIKESAHKIWLAGLGALAAAEEEGAKVFNTLVERGEKYESRGKKELAKVKDKVEGALGKAEGSWEKVGDSFDEKVAGVIQKLGVPTSDEITTLTRQVEELTLKVDQLKADPKKSK
jgi:poly(hydroxyalkanoate) granule-associated protein